MVILRERRDRFAACVCGCIDDYRFVANPLGKGKSMFDGVRSNIDLRLKKARTFQNGTVLDLVRARVAAPERAGEGPISWSPPMARSESAESPMLDGRPSRDG
jgi:hypothetical protein